MISLFFARSQFSLITRRSSGQICPPQLIVFGEAGASGRLGSRLCSTTLRTRPRTWQRTGLWAATCYSGLDDRSPVAVSLRGALNRNPVITEHPAAGMESIERALLDSTEGTLRQVLQVKRINNPMRCNKELCLLATRIDTLRDKDHSNADEPKILMDVQGVGQPPAQSAGVVH